MRRVFAAEPTVLAELELVGCRPLIFRRGVVPILALTTFERDNYAICHRPNPD